MWVNHEGNAKIYDGSAADLLLFDSGRRGFASELKTEQKSRGVEAARDAISPAAA